MNNEHRIERKRNIPFIFMAKFFWKLDTRNMTSKYNS